MIVHPRWCPYCLRAREEKIRDNYENRRIFPPSADKDKARQEREYNEYRRGVIEGRIRGLSRPLYNGNANTTGLSNGNGQSQAREEVDDRLVTMMSTQKLTHFDEGWTREQMEMEQFFQDQRHFWRGIRAGRKLQVGIELKALRIADAKERKEFLDNALL